VLLVQSLAWGSHPCWSGAPNTLGCQLARTLNGTAPDCQQNSHCLACLTLSMSFLAALNCWSSTSSDGHIRSDTAARLGAGRERRWGTGA
jgi:hypothetical protein